MKLRFRKNSLRLRVNRREVEELASGARLEEEIHFPGNSRISYVLEVFDGNTPRACFVDGTIRVSAPRGQIDAWANGESMGLYYDLPADGAELRIAIEKDLECIDGPPEERDPEAFPRRTGKNC